MMKSQVAEKYVSLVQGMNVGVGLHQGSPVVCIGDEQVDRRGQAWVSADDRTECVCE